MVSKRDLNSAEVETTRTSRSPTTVMTVNGEVQTREEATVCQGLGLIRDGYVSWSNSHSSFTREALQGSWVYLPLDQRSKTTSHQKWQEKSLQCGKLRATWFSDEFLCDTREQKWKRVLASTVLSTLTSRKTQTATSAWRRKYQGLLSEDVPVQSCPERTILVTW